MGSGFHEDMFWTKYYNLVWFLLLLFLDSAVASSIVRSLPGFPGSLPFKLQTGYIGVGENEESQLFYYFIESESDPPNDPLILWLSGGPGCSSLSGLALENGPIQFKMVQNNGTVPTLILNPNSWTKVANIIYLDAPIGAGFSYSTTSQGYYTGDKLSATQTYAFLRKWLLNHRDFIENPLYIAGDSYSGITVPMVTQHIAEGIEVGHKPTINLKGYLVGNPITDLKFDGNARLEFAREMALISDELYQSAKVSCKGEYQLVDPSNVQCLNDIEAIKECAKHINNHQVLEPLCRPESDANEENNGERRRVLMEEFGIKILEIGVRPIDFAVFGCRNYENALIRSWSNDASVQKALHVRKGMVNNWVRCNRSLAFTFEAHSVVSYHRYLHNKGYRALVYSGDHDMLAPYLGTLAWIKSLNLSITNHWRPWLVDNEVAGFTIEYANRFTFTTIKGGGHTAPEYRPKECYAMFRRWISEETL